MDVVNVYTTVVQAVLLYGSVLWVVYPWIGKALGRFHHRVILRLAGKFTQRNG